MKTEAKPAGPGTAGPEAPCTDGVVAAESAHTSGFYHKRPLVLVRGEGAVVWDSEGREYVDCDAGHGVALLGHRHPAVVAAISGQLDNLLTCGESFYHPARAAFLEALEGVLPGGLDRFFLCNSGTEAVEAAIKLARLATGRPGVVAFRRGFHGRTMGSLSATWNPRYRGPFGPLLDGFEHVPFNDLAAAGAAISGDTAAVIVEPVQGEGGVFPAEAGFLAGLREACDRTGALLVFDEVQTGVGRTGAFVAAQRFGVNPDLLCLAKGLAGGLPVGVMAFGPRAGGVEPGLHASTYGGNPVVCAAGAAVVRAVAGEGLARRAEELGLRFMELLGGLAGRMGVVREVRGLGLMLAVDLRVRAGRYLQAMQDRGVLALSAGPTVIRLLPPLVITWEQLQRVFAVLEEVLTEPGPTGPATDDGGQ